MTFTHLALLGALVAAPAAGGSPRFYPDDPLLVDPETEDAATVVAFPASQGYDFVENTFLHPGERTSQRAVNLNTLDEVPDSSWFVNRIGARPMTADEVLRGPDQDEGPVPGKWRIRGTKSEGVTPGFRMRDAQDRLYFVKLDPPANLEMATAAEVISTHILHAAGYHVPENHIAFFRAEDLDIEGAKVALPTGGERPMDAVDLERLLARAAPLPDGRYRVLASVALAGKPVGPFRYYGTRSDDPNDIHPHEHRRELRGLRVVAAWVNHMDSRGINSLDMLVEADGRKRVRHNLLDFGSTLGSAAIAVKSRRSGNDYLWNVRQSLVEMASLGLVVPDWTRVAFRDIPSIGRIESDHFTPERWVPHYPNPAFDNARPDDLFWGARRVMAFSDELVRAAVRAGKLSDPVAADHLVRILCERRDKIGRAWLTVVNPLVGFALSADGALTFANAAVDAGVATPPTAYAVTWYRFDNRSGEASPVGVETRWPGARTTCPRELALGEDEYLQATVRSLHPEHPVWATPVRVSFRRTPAGFQTVGLER